MLRVVTFNANGIRSAATKGFWDWFEQTDAQVLCVQELKAQEADIANEVRHRAGYHSLGSLRAKKRLFGRGTCGRRWNPTMW